MTDETKDHTTAAQAASATTEIDPEDILQIEDEAGNIRQYEHLLTFSYNKEPFIAFTPIEPAEDEEAGEVYIMRIAGEDDNDYIYAPIESEEELDTLWDVFRDLYYSGDTADTADISATPEQD